MSHEVWSRKSPDPDPFLVAVIGGLKEESEQKARFLVDQLDNLTDGRFPFIYVSIDEGQGILETRLEHAEAILEHKIRSGGE